MKLAAIFILLPLIALLGFGTGKALAQGDSSLEIFEVEIEDIESTSAVIAWKTNIYGDSVVNYGTSPATGSDAFSYTATNEATGVQHSVPLTGLTPDTEYFFEVQSTGSDGTPVIDDNYGEFYSFTTSKAKLDKPKRRAFVGKVQGTPDATVTLIRQGTGEEITIMVLDVVPKTPGGPRAGEFVEGAKVVILSEWVDDAWVARKILVKPVKKQYPVIGVVTQIVDGVATVESPDGTIQTIILPDGSDVSVGDVITALSGTHGKAKGIVKADRVRDRMEKFLKNIDKLDKLEDRFSRGGRFDHRQRQADSLLRLLEFLEDRQLGMIDGVLDRIPERAKAHVRRARARIEEARASGESIRDRIKERFEIRRDHRDEGRGRGRGRSGGDQENRRPDRDGGPERDNHPGNGRGRGNFGSGSDNSGSGSASEEGSDSKSEKEEDKGKDNNKGRDGSSGGRGHGRG